MMRERRKIIELWERGDALAMITLVHVEGSSYRRPGARMLIASNGDYAGSISGGCLEAEVIRKASWLMQQGACVQRYSTLFDDTSEIPYGLGCGGVVDLLIEPANTPEFEMVMDALKSSIQGESVDVITWLPGREGKLRRFASRVERAGEVREGKIPGWPRKSNVFRERLEPPQRLFVLGAGDDAQPLAQMAVTLGWRVVVVDGRPQWARQERFPGTEQVICTAAPGSIKPEHQDAAVVMTHSYEQDREWLRFLLPCNPRYLGLLGARHRSALLANETAATLGWPLEQVCERLFAPVGLDLGGDGAEAIALAIMAEIQSCIEGKLARSRRMTAEVISEQTALGDASRYQLSQCTV